jgi:Peptidase family M28
VPLPRRASLVILVCGGLATAPSASPRLPDSVVRAVGTVTAAELRIYVERLASDEFRGRGVGDAGNRAAEEFVCTTLVHAGLTPAGSDGSCYQSVDLYRPELGEHARLTITDDRGDTLLDAAAGPEFYPLPTTGKLPATAPLTSGDPRDAIARVDADGDSERGVDAALAGGAQGVLMVARYLSDVHDVWPDTPSIRSATYRLLSDLRRQPRPLAVISQPAAEPVRRALHEGRRLSASLTPDLIATPVRIHNVLGLVEGRDGRHRDEIVVVGAHLDHDGIGDDGRIYRGADDNASGTAAVMAAAAAFAPAAAGGERPARAVLFALWNGEEKGSLGAEAFLDAPQPARRVVANLNLDMVGRHEEVPDPADWRFSGFPKVDAGSSGNTLHVLGYSYAPGLAAEVRDANAAVGLTLKEDYDVGAQGLLQRSDQWPFLRRGIPALFLTTGLHPDYHTPDDEPARIDFGKLERVARLAARAAWIVADGKPPRMTASHRH